MAKQEKSDRRAEKAASQEAEGESAVLTAIAAMHEPYRTMGKKIHAIVRANAPGLLPRTWYGMPAYADKDGNIICFFRGNEKFGERYMTLGFNNYARLDEGNMWATSFALIKMTSKEEARIAQLVKKAVS